MLFSASILSGLFLDTLFGKHKLFSFIRNFLKSFWCIPFVCGSAIILFNFYGTSPFLFYLVHTILCFITLQIGEIFCASTPVYEQADPHTLKETLEQLCTMYLDSSAVSILSMLIGGAPLMMIVNLIVSHVSSDSFIKQVIRYIPARLGAFFLMIVCGMLGYDFNNGRRIYQRDRKNYQSSEVGQILSVYAGALHLCFPARQPFTIGNVNRSVVFADIPTLKHICLFSSWFMILVGCFVRLSFTL